MENYVYLTSTGNLGYVQIEENLFYFYPYKPHINCHVGVRGWRQELWVLRFNTGVESSKPASQSEIKDALGKFLTQEYHQGKVLVTEIRAVNDAGSYYPRMNFGEPGLSYLQVKTKERADETRSFENIFQGLTEIFRTLEPEPGNFNAYGNSIRELLIIACTEVEYLLKSILRSNIPEINCRNLSTKDYVKISPILKLNHYRISLPFYPELGFFSPFENWNQDQPTASLSWYCAYNSVKHDRGNSKNKATLEMLINAIAAIHILLESQYGEELFEFRYQHTFRTIFHTEKRPEWYFNEINCPILDREGVIWNKQKNHSR
ncbi:hypothetical protein [Pantoea ananatis]|uniref:hypothetical protein n=1 Tax=Pantoea ananas TaxID=553 RepID=UPI000DA6BE60|nr:hypothetical protein [Pantoea ananatis]PZD60705.1 hypothetical protein ARC272_18035 [Pantoea ananatis]